MKLVEDQSVTGTLENSRLADIFPTGSVSTVGKAEMFHCFPNGLTCKSHNKKILVNKNKQYQSQYVTGSTILNHLRIRDPGLQSHSQLKPPQDLKTNHWQRQDTEQDEPSTSFSQMHILFRKNENTNSRSSSKQLRQLRLLN